MPFFLIIVGVVFLVSASKGTQNQLFTLLKGDFSGPNNYFYWLASILVVGAFGYIPKFKPVSDMFLVLIVLSLVLTRGKAGLFQKVSAALALTNKPAATASTLQSQNSSLVASGTPAINTELNSLVGALTNQSATTQLQAQNFNLGSQPSNVDISGLIQ